MPIWLFIGIGILVVALTAWSLFGLIKAVRELREATDAGRRLGLKVTVVILSVRLALVFVVAALMVWTVLRA